KCGVTVGAVSVGQFSLLAGRLKRFRYFAQDTSRAGNSVLGATKIPNRYVLAHYQVERCRWLRVVQRRGYDLNVIRRAVWKWGGTEREESRNKGVNGVHSPSPSIWLRISPKKSAAWF